MLRTRNAVGQFIHVHRKSGEQFSPDDLTVFIPDAGDWTCTIEGKPDEPGRALIVRDLNELHKLYEALALALAIIEEQDHLPPVPGDERNTGDDSQASAARDSLSSGGWIRTRIEHYIREL